MEINGKILFKCPLMPPIIKEKISSLIARDKLTWDYMMKQGMFLISSESMYPTEYVL